VQANCSCVCGLRRVKRRQTNDNLAGVEDLGTNSSADVGTFVVEWPKALLRDEERERISSLYTSHDFEAEPLNM
jgi:hypothetical protein